MKATLYAKISENPIDQSTRIEYSLHFIPEFTPIVRFDVVKPVDTLGEYSTAVPVLDDGTQAYAPSAIAEMVRNGNIEYEVIDKNLAEEFLIPIEPLFNEGN
jgi:hypothetical protein